MSEVSREELKAAALSGVRWATAARLTAETSAFVATVVLAHLVSPAEVGRAAVALILNVLALILVWDGLGVPLVQKKEIGRHQLESAFATSLLVGGAMTAAVLVLAPFTAPLFGERTADLMQLMSPALLLAGLGVVAQSLLQRRLDFKRSSIIEATSVLAGSAAAISFAVAGLDAESIVLGALTKMGVSVLLLNLAVVTWWPRWRGRAAGELVRFGAPAALASFAYQGLRNVDYAIIGAQLNAAAVGFYYRAFQLGVDYQGKLSAIVVRLAFPLYSRTPNLEEMRRLRSRIVRVQAALIFPLLAMFIALAPVLVPWLFGARWEPAVVPAQILAVAGMANAVGVVTGPLILAAGHARPLLAFNLGSLAAYALAVYLAAPFGLVAVSATVTAFYLLVSLLGSQYLLLRRYAGVPLRSLVPEVGPAAVSSAALLAVTVPVVQAFEGWGFAAVITLTVATALGLAVYIALLSLVFRSAWRDLAMLLRQVLGPSRLPWLRVARPSPSAP